MKDLWILLAPVFWSIRNDILRFNRVFYRKAFLYLFTSGIFILIITKLLNIGMMKLQNLPSDIFLVLLTKGYSLIFILIFIIQIINGLAISLNTYYQSKDLEVLFTSPVNRTSLFLSRLFETQVKASWMLVVFGIPLLLSSGLVFEASLFYHVFSIFLFFVFSTIPVNIGIGLTFLLTGFLHIRKIKRFLLSAGVIMLVLLITLFRIFKPESFVNPELFANVTLFISEMKTPSFFLFPSRWLGESLFHLLNKQYSNTTIFVSLLFLTSYLTIPAILFVYKKYHYRGWSLLQEGSLVAERKKSWFSVIGAFAFKALFKPVQWLSLWTDTGSRNLMSKDFLYQIREIRNIHQLLILSALVVVYLFSIASLPINWENIYYATKLKYIISFFNLGLILIIAASLCSRIVYPSVASDGNFLWIFKISPLTSRRYVWTKFFFFFIPICIFAELLVLFSSIFIDIEKDLLIMIIITTAVVSFSLVSMAITFAISDFKHALKESGREQTKTGSTVYMVLSVFLVLFTLAVEAVPIFLYFLKESAKVEFTGKTWLIMGGTLFVLLLINMLATFLSLHLGIKKYANLELI